MAAGKIYNDDVKAKALLALEANGGNVLATAREIGIPSMTIRNWSHGIGVGKEIKKKIDANRLPLATRLHDVAHLLLDHAIRKLKKARLGEIGSFLSMAIEKALVLEGQATSIVGRKDLPDDERLELLQRILNAAQERQREEAAKASQDSQPVAALPVPSSEA